MSFSSMLTRYPFKTFFATLKIRVRRTWVKGKIFASPAPAFFPCLALPGLACIADLNLLGIYAWLRRCVGPAATQAILGFIPWRNWFFTKMLRMIKEVTIVRQFFLSLHDKFTAWFCSVCITSSRSTQSPIWAITGRLPWPAKGADSKVFVSYGTKR